MTSQGWSVDSFLDNGFSSGTQRYSSVADWLVASCVVACLLSFDADWTHSPLYFKWLPVGALALSSLCALAITTRNSSIRFDIVDSCALLLLGWVAASLAWSPNTLGGRDVLIKWALLTAVFIALRHASTSSTHVKIAGAIAVSLFGILVMDRLGIAESGSYFNQNYETEAILLGLPFLLIFNGTNTKPWLRWGVRLLAIGSAFFLVYFNPSKIEFLVWAGCGMFFTVAILWRRSKLQAFSILLPLLVATGLLIYLGWDQPLFGESHGFRDSIHPRLELLANGFAMWIDSPVIGHGAGFMYPVYPLFQEHYIQLLGAGYRTSLLTGFYTSAGALHNEYIQFLAGFGLVGFALIAVSVYAARAQLRAWQNSASHLAGTAVVVACLVNAMVDFPLQNAASAMLAVLGFTWLIPGTSDAGEKLAPSAIQVHLRHLPLVILVLVAPAIGWWGYRYYLGHDAYGVALKIAPTRPDLSLQLNLGAVGAYPLDDAFRYQLYNTLMFMEENAGHPVAPPAFHDQMIDLGLTAGPGNVLAILRLEYLLNSGRYKERPEEVAKWRRQLTTNVTRLPDTWLMEGLYELAYGRPKQAKEALNRYLDLTGGKISEERKSIVEAIQAGIGR
ncbi:MAG: O-antigen ligase family protein [Sterolibacteriaceae bacterium MAG5]|nr:O-antigen ligase family protein [Candidatus Nitricoxidireducens bremensis]